MSAAVVHEPVSHVVSWPEPADVLVFGPVEDVRLVLTASSSSLAGCGPCARRVTREVAASQSALLTATAMRRAMETGYNPFPIEGEKQIVGESLTQMSASERLSFAATEVSRIHEHIVRAAKEAL